MAFALTIYFIRLSKLVVKFACGICVSSSGIWWRRFGVVMEQAVVRFQGQMSK